MSPHSALATVFFAGLTGCAAPPEANATPAETARVVAVGDLHADLDNALAALRLGGVIDEQGRWAAGTATFVQTGDITDRGPDSKALIELMQRLEVEAATAGGKVVALLGNHEAMNLTGDWRYVHPGDLTAFGGQAQRKAALAPTGDPGRWLRRRDAVVRVQDTVFAHGGVHPAIAKMGIERINQGIRDGLDNKADPRLTTILLGVKGPLWYRGYVEDPETEACPRLAQALTALGATRMVVGHTTRRDGRIQVRCEGRLHVIDIGIADHYGGHLGAWTSAAGDARARYPDGDRDLRDPA